MAGKHTQPSSALLRGLIRRHECGVVQTSLHTVKGFVSWVFLWDIQISHEHSCRPSIKCCWTESLRCLTFSPLGHCWCIVPITSSMWFHPSWVRSSPVHITDPVGLSVMGISEDACEATTAKLFRCHLFLGGLGLRSALRTHPTACWASWADLLHNRHPGVVGNLLTQLEGAPVGHSLTSALAAARFLGVHGFDIPSWRSLASGPRPLLVALKTMSLVAHGRHEASLTLTNTEKTMLCSQSGPGAGAFSSTTPANPLTRIDSFSFRTLLCHKLRLAVPLSSRTAPLITLATTVLHVPVQGGLARRGFAIESAVARICGEGGGGHQPAGP